MGNIAIGLLILAAAAARYPDFWIVTETRDLEEIVFIDKTSINPRTDGWTNFTFETVYNGAHHKSYKSDRSVGWVRCAARTFMIDTLMAYGDDGRLVSELSQAEPQHPVAAGSVEAALFDFVCGSQTGVAELPRGTYPVTAADTLYAGLSGAARRQAPADGARSPARAAKSVKAAQDFWMVGESADFTLIAFVDKASIARGADGKPSFTMELVSNAGPDTQKAKRLRSRATLDCARRTFGESEATAYDSRNRVTGRTPAKPEAAIQPRTMVNDIYAFVCARDQKNAIQVSADAGETPLTAAAFLYNEHLDSEKRNAARRPPDR